MQSAVEGADFGGNPQSYSAGVAELVDAPDLGSGAARRGGSSPFTRTKITSYQTLQCAGLSAGRPIVRGTTVNLAVEYGKNR